MRVRAVRTVYHGDRRYRPGEEFIYDGDELPKSGSMEPADIPPPPPAASRRVLSKPAAKAAPVEQSSEPTGSQSVI